jgi:hypothetical protein
MAFQRKKPAAICTKAPHPGFIEPELATSVEKVLLAPSWGRFFRARMPGATLANNE